ncbi:DUF6408 family protein [Streptomyces umbrinus]
MASKIDLRQLARALTWLPLRTFPEGTSAVFQVPVFGDERRVVSIACLTRCDCGCPVGRSLPFPAHAQEWKPMNPVEYTLARRDRIRQILVDVTVGVITNLLVTTLAVVARLVF